jgi:hypothetical protein
VYSSSSTEFNIDVMLTYIFCLSDHYFVNLVYYSKWEGHTVFYGNIFYNTKRAWTHVFLIYLQNARKGPTTFPCVLCNKRTKKRDWRKIIKSVSKYLEKYFMLTMYIIIHKILYSNVTDLWTKIMFQHQNANLHVVCRVLHPFLFKYHVHQKAIPFVSYVKNRDLS